MPACETSPSPTISPRTTARMCLEGTPATELVPLTSQLNGASTRGSPGDGGPVTNVIHSAGLYSLDFIGFNGLSSGIIAATPWIY